MGALCNGVSYYVLHSTLYAVQTRGSQFLKYHCRNYKLLSGGSCEYFRMLKYYVRIDYVAVRHDLLRIREAAGIPMLKPRKHLDSNHTDKSAILVSFPSDGLTGSCPWPEIGLEEVRRRSPSDLLEARLWIPSNGRLSGNWLGYWSQARFSVPILVKLQNPPSGPE
jgi:hypothetical protein